MRGKLPGSGGAAGRRQGQGLLPPTTTAPPSTSCSRTEKKYRGSDNHDAVKEIPQFDPPAPPGKGDDQKHEARMVRDDPGSQQALVLPTSTSRRNLTEIILLGLHRDERRAKAVRMEWEWPEHEVAQTSPEAAKFVKRDSRPGWELLERGRFTFD